MKSAVTVSLVPEAIKGPFVFHCDLPAACRTASELGFNAIELFAPGPDTVPVNELKKLLGDHGLTLAAVGTGAGWLQKKLSLTSPDAGNRKEAIRFVTRMMEYGLECGAPAIIGSMQGKAEGRPLDDVQAMLADSVRAVVNAGEGTILYEPLNRYETDLFNQIAPAADWMTLHELPRVKLLADLFHMSIEEVNLDAVLSICGDAIGHVHLADSNRGPAGAGHTDFAPIGHALKLKGYEGYISAEAFPQPDAREAAAMTMDAFGKHFL